MGEKIVSKSDFAGACNVTPSCVANWISRGKISGDALVGEGRGARIKFDVAMAQLKERLDPSQRFGLNGISTKLDDAPATPHGPSPPPSSARPPAQPFDPSVEDQIKREKLLQAQLATSRAKEQDRLSRGVYILAAEARDETKRAAAQLVASFEGRVPDLAAAIAAKWQLPARDVTHLLRAEIRKIRARLAAEFAELAAAEPEFIDDDLDDDNLGRKN
ncbi:hypothetical protein [Methylocystis rosea]|uniref:Uncharacterized protein n=1 Tax=Methylocystis rosea TaxID=173366 RepID=A0A3G8M5D0_9HYPH|nr:hypothetical protein [Methylocystis rosea]AZG76290.1 hypothetical protein EHO51_05860 [Methylocystis rosea]